MRRIVHLTTYAYFSQVTRTLVKYNSGLPYRRIACSSPRSGTVSVVYTDGACTSNGYPGARGGIGVFWGRNDPRNVSEPLPDGRQTSNRAEILACAKAIEQATEQGLKLLEIRTDSNFTIKCVSTYLQNWKSNGWRKSNGEPVQNMEELISLDYKKMKFEQLGGRVIFTHVAGHSSEPGNDAADRLAVQGATKQDKLRYTCSEH